MPEYRKLSETIKDLEHYDGTYKRESVDAATGLKDEISPVLIKKGKTKEELPFEIEKMIRAYDPCMSCAAHFLKVDWI